MLQEAGVPFVLIGRTGDTAGLAYVDIDFDQTVRDAVDHLVGLGHRRDRLRQPLGRDHRQRLRAGPAHPGRVRGGDGAATGWSPLMIPADDSAAGGRRGARDRPGADA